MVAAVAEADEVGGDSCSGQGRRQRHTEATSMVDKDEGSGGRSGQRRQRRRTRTCATMAARPWTWTLRRMQRRVARVHRLLRAGPRPRAMRTAGRLISRPLAPSPLQLSRKSYMDLLSPIIVRPDNNWFVGCGLIHVCN
ncbi:unknown protein [Oryza sativa Japonica Group]|uniref:p0460E08.1 protein n=1 Tax=Oryza sativa subsp. japonica TaxID=39947 RepID=Q94DU2_ORYSJ|nr:P0460E08.1 [Oryza sativa Japonica Group]BAB90230.1 unknown protein [Oryza sativa Japonica Group]